MRRDIIQILFPLNGLDRAVGYQRQPPYSTPDCSNVRPRDVYKRRLRGGSRPGISVVFQPNLGYTTRMLEAVDWVSAGVTKRTICLQAYDKFFYDDGAGGVFTELVAPGQALSVDKQLMAADLLSKLYIADTGAGKGLTVFDPSANSLELVVASAGSVPTGCPILARWRGRIVLGGPTGQWYMSRVDDPTDWNYAANPDDPKRAVSGGTSEAGDIAENLTAIIPHVDDTALFCSARGMWACRGDPAAGGVIFQTSAYLGCVDKFAWTHTPDGVVYFLSAVGLCSVPASGNAPPQLVSVNRLPAELRDLSSATYQITLAYDSYENGIHLHASRKAGSGTSIHYWISLEGTPSFWPLNYGLGNSFDPMAWTHRSVTSGSPILFGTYNGHLICYADSSRSDMKMVAAGTNRVAGTDYGSGHTTVTANSAVFDSADVGGTITIATVGSFDISAYTSSTVVTVVGNATCTNKAFSMTTTSNIASHVIIGPIRLGGNDYAEGMLVELLGTLAADSSGVTWEAYVADTAEAATTAAITGTSPQLTGLWVAGRSVHENARLRGGALCLRLKKTGTETTTAWALEQLSGTIERLGVQRSL